MPHSNTLLDHLAAQDLRDHYPFFAVSNGPQQAAFKRGFLKAIEIYIIDKDQCEGIIKALNTDYMHEED